MGGNLIWQSSFDGSDFLFSKIDKNNDIYIIYSPGGILKHFSSDGELLKEFQLKLPSDQDNIVSAVIGSNKEIYYLAEVDSENMRTNFFIAESDYNSGGEYKWYNYCNNYAYDKDDFPSAIAIDYNGNIIVTGQTEAYWQVGITPRLRFFNILFNPDGKEIGNVTTLYNSGADKFTKSIASHIGVVDSSNFVIAGINKSGSSHNPGVYHVVLSYNFNSSLTMDSCWCEYTLVTIDNETTDPPNKYYLFQNYPNPFNPTTTIAYAIPERGIVSLKVYDVLGREIETLVNDYKRSGQYEVNFDATHQSSGVYFYTLQAGNYRDIKKMLLLR